MTITITAFEASPDRGQGLARDTRVRWALEEVGQPYEVRLLSFLAMKEPAHLALHPFGQIPTYEEGDLGLFETGAIVFHIAERHAGLLPSNANARARAIAWMFAAVNTVEPPILELATAKLVESDKPWSEERLLLLHERVRNRLKQISVRLGGADWLDGAFSAGDLMMVHVLQRLKPSGILGEFSNLSAYVARGEARPAYKRAFAGQLAVFTNKNAESVRSAVHEQIIRSNTMTNSIRTCLWFKDGRGPEAAAFYCALIPGSRVERIFRFDNGMGAASVTDFTLGGAPYQILDAGPHFDLTEAVSISVETDDQAESDRIWYALTADGGKESACGWLKDRYGVSWQVYPKRLTELTMHSNEAVSKAAMAEMMKQKKIDIAAIEAAVKAVT